MVPIEFLTDTVKRRYPIANVVLDRPQNQHSVWFLDVEVSSQKLSVEWRPSSGYKVFLGTDEVHANFANSEYAAMVTCVNSLLGANNGSKGNQPAVRNGLQKQT